MEFRRIYAKEWKVKGSQPRKPTGWRNRRRSRTKETHTCSQSIEDEDLSLLPIQFSHFLFFLDIVEASLSILFDNHHHHHHEARHCHLSAHRRFGRRLCPFQDGLPPHRSLCDRGCHGKEGACHLTMLLEARSFRPSITLFASIEAFWSSSALFLN